MICEINLNNDEVNVTISGTIDVDVATSMKERLFPLIEKGFKHFVFYLDEVEDIDSSGIGILVVIRKKVAQMDGRVILKGLQGNVKEIFQVTKLARNFELQ